MSWWYYYAQYGPGHQSHSDGFFELPDDSTQKDAEEHVDDLVSIKISYSAIYYVWPVALDKRRLHERCNTIKSRIKSLRQELKQLQSNIASSTNVPPSKDGYDREVMLALYGKHQESLLKNLHDDGIIVDSHEVYLWFVGIRSPHSSIRDRVISCGKRSNRFVGLSYINNREVKETRQQWGKNAERYVEKKVELIEKLSKNRTKEKK